MMRPAAVMCAGLLATTAMLVSAQDTSVLAGRFRSGRFEAVFEATGRYRFLSGGQVGLTGALAVRGDTVAFTDDGGPAACVGVPGTHRFVLAGDTLRLTLVSDECQGRRNALAQPWVRDRSSEFALTNVTVIDGTGAPARPGMTVVVRDGRITGVFPTGSVALPVGVTPLELPGRFVLPGLIDAHVHLATDPSGGDGRAQVERRLRHALRGGITAVRDMAGDGRVLADLGRAAFLGEIESPAIYYSALMSGPGFFEDPRVHTSSRGVAAGSAPWARAVTAETLWPLAVAEAKGTGATGIKLYAEIPAELVRAITAEAHRQGLKVWGHATLAPARPSEVVAAGVDAVSHAGLLLWEVETLPDFRRRLNADYTKVRPDDPRLVRLFHDMAARGVALDATLYVYRNNAAAIGFAAEVVRLAHAAGVPILAGTDAIGAPGDGPLPHLHDELELLVTRAGLTPLAAIMAATLAPARVLGIEATHGSIAVGNAADLVVLSADPLADIRNTRRLEAVYHAGKRLAPAP